MSRSTLDTTLSIGEALNHVRHTANQADDAHRAWLDAARLHRDAVCLAKLSGASAGSIAIAAGVTRGRINQVTRGIRSSDYR